MTVTIMNTTIAMIHSFVLTQAHCGNPGQGGAVSVGLIWHACIAIGPAKHRWYIHLLRVWLLQRYFHLLRVWLLQRVQTITPTFRRIATTPTTITIHMITATTNTRLLMSHTIITTRLMTITGLLLRLWLLQQ